MHTDPHHAAEQQPHENDRGAVGLVGIYRPDAEQPPHDLEPGISLSQFCWRYVFPICLAGRSPRTLEAYQGSISYWILSTGDPSLDKIDAWTCAEFVRGLSTLKGRTGGPISPNTVRKHCRHLQYCLDRAGPRTRENRLGIGIIENTPYLNPPRQYQKPPIDSFRHEEVVAWLGACWRARVPRLPGLDPGQWWDGLVRFLYNTGLRIGTALAVTSEMIEDQWLVIPPGATKCHRGQRLFLNDAARAVLHPHDRSRGDNPHDRSRGDNPHDRSRGVIFPWPHHFTHLHTVRRRLLELAGIPPERRFGFHGLRKALATHLASENPMVAQMVMGHASAQTTREHYVHPHVVAAVMQAVPRLPETRADPQLRLF